MKLSSPVVSNCIITHNSAVYLGGGIHCDILCSPEISRCTISHNSSLDGGGIGAWIASPVITDCYISENFVSQCGCGIICTEEADAAISGCTITGNTAFLTGGGIQVHDNSTACIDQCNISDNITLSFAGGGINTDDSSPLVSNCIITGNNSAEDGGGICCSYQFPSITNCIIYGNTTDLYGGGIACRWSSPSITNCTITRNTASDYGGIYCYVADPTIVNSIFWDDCPNEISKNPRDYDVSYCNVQGGYTGTGNIDADPMFVDAGNDNFHLRSWSPCIDRGTDQGMQEYDYEGDLRYDHPFKDNNPSILDMGADEFDELIVYSVPAIMPLSRTGSMRLRTMKWCSLQTGYIPAGGTKTLITRENP